MNEEKRKVSVKEKPVIKVIGVGGAGCNALNNIITALSGLLEPDAFIAMNTDRQSLLACKAETKVQLGSGLGAGSDPEVGKEAAISSQEAIEKVVEDCDLVILIAGLGGGTGSGAGPQIAEFIREKGVLVLSVATKPFSFEGSVRAGNAKKAIEELEQKSDTVIVLENQALLSGPIKTFIEALREADRAIESLIGALARMLFRNAFINVDYADLRTVIMRKGAGLAGIGTGTAEKAAKEALSNPLIAKTFSLERATHLLVVIIGDQNMSLMDVEVVMSTATAQLGKGVTIIYGTSVEENLNIEEGKESQIQVLVLATGNQPCSQEIQMQSEIKEPTPEAKTPNVSVLRQWFKSKSL